MRRWLTRELRDWRTSVKALLWCGVIIGVLMFGSAAFFHHAGSHLLYREPCRHASIRPEWHGEADRAWRAVICTKTFDMPWSATHLHPVRGSDLSAAEYSTRGASARPN